VVAASTTDREGRLKNASNDDEVKRKGERIA
jgi:hypothetical protein